MHLSSSQSLAQLRPSSLDTLLLRQPPFLTIDHMRFASVQASAVRSKLCQLSEQTCEKDRRKPLGLPASGRAALVEQLLASLAGGIDPHAEQSHLAEIQKRRAAVDSGKAKLIDGSPGLLQVRAAIRP